MEQLLCACCGSLLSDPPAPELPAGCAAAAFLAALADQLRAQPPLGGAIRVPLPPGSEAAAPMLAGLLVEAGAGAGAGGAAAPPGAEARCVEFRLPPDCGNGYVNAGVGLARLLWQLPPRAVMTLLASLLLERRVVFVGQSRDAVSAAVVAANALLYPMRWGGFGCPEQGSCVSCSARERASAMGQRASVHKPRMQGYSSLGRRWPPARTLCAQLECVKHFRSAATHLAALIANCKPRRSF